MMLVRCRSVPVAPQLLDVGVAVFGEVLLQHDLLLGANTERVLQLVHVAGEARDGHRVRVVHVELGFEERLVVRVLASLSTVPSGEGIQRLAPLLGLRPSLLLRCPRRLLLRHPRSLGLELVLQPRLAQELEFQPGDHGRQVRDPVAEDGGGEGEGGAIEEDFTGASSRPRFDTRGAEATAGLRDTFDPASSRGERLLEEGEKFDVTEELAEDDVTTFVVLDTLDGSCPGRSTENAFAPSCVGLGARVFLPAVC
jgi:hypothetical protein